jgi:hypothetical protein
MLRPDKMRRVDLLNALLGDDHEDARVRLRCALNRDAPL